MSAIAKNWKTMVLQCGSSSYLINMNYIKLIDGNTVLVGEDELAISRLKRKDFMQSFNEWAAKSGIN